MAPLEPEAPQRAIPLGTCRLGNCTLGKLPLGKLSFGRKLLWESNNKSLIFLNLKTTPIVEELIGAADACQGDSGGPMVTHEGILVFFMKVGLW